MTRANRIFFAAAIVVAVLASLVLPVRRDKWWCDPISGSSKSQTYWPLGITTGPAVDVSAMETRLHAIGYHWPPVWRFVYNTHRTVWGRATEWDCGMAPPIYYLRPLSEWFTKTSTDAELYRFAGIMQSGTEEEQKAAVYAVCEKWRATLGGDRMHEQAK